MMVDNFLICLIYFFIFVCLFMLLKILITFNWIFIYENENTALGLIFSAFIIFWIMLDYFHKSLHIQNFKSPVLILVCYKKYL